MINIKDLNKITKNDVYSLFFQNDIIDVVIDYKYINTVNVVN